MTLMRIEAILLRSTRPGAADIDCGKIAGTLWGFGKQIGVIPSTATADVVEYRLALPSHSALVVIIGCKPHTSASCL